MTGVRGRGPCLGAVLVLVCRGGGLGVGVAGQVVGNALALVAQVAGLLGALEVGDARLLYVAVLVGGHALGHALVGVDDHVRPGLVGVGGEGHHVAVAGDLPDLHGVGDEDGLPDGVEGGVKGRHLVEGRAVCQVVGLVEGTGVVSVDVQLLEGGDHVEGRLARGRVDIHVLAAQEDGSLGGPTNQLVAGTAERLRAHRLVVHGQGEGGIGQVSLGEGAGGRLLPRLEGQGAAGRAVAVGDGVRKEEEAQDLRPGRTQGPVAVQVLVGVGRHPGACDGLGEPVAQVGVAVDGQTVVDQVVVALAGASGHGAVGVDHRIGPALVGNAVRVGVGRDLLVGLLDGPAVGVAQDLAVLVQGRELAVAREEPALHVVGHVGLGPVVEEELERTVGGDLAVGLGGHGLGRAEEVLVGVGGLVGHEVVARPVELGAGGDRARLVGADGDAPTNGLGGGGVRLCRGVYHALGLVGPDDLLGAVAVDLDVGDGVGHVEGSPVGVEGDGAHVGREGGTGNDRTTDLGGEAVQDVAHTGDLAVGGLVTLAVARPVGGQGDRGARLEEGRPDLALLGPDDRGRAGGAGGEGPVEGATVGVDAHLEGGGRVEEGEDRGARAGHGAGAQLLAEVHGVVGGVVGGVGLACRALGAGADVHVLGVVVALVGVGGRVPLEGPAGGVGPAVLVQGAQASHGGVGRGVGVARVGDQVALVGVQVVPDVGVGDGLAAHRDVLAVCAHQVGVPVAVYAPAGHVVGDLLGLEDEGQVGRAVGRDDPGGLGLSGHACEGKRRHAAQDRERVARGSPDVAVQGELAGPILVRGRMQALVVAIGAVRGLGLGRVDGLVGRAVRIGLLAHLDHGPIAPDLVDVHGVGGVVGGDPDGVEGVCGRGHDVAVAGLVGVEGCRIHDGRVEGVGHIALGVSDRDGLSRIGGGVGREGVGVVRGPTHQPVARTVNVGGDGQGHDRLGGHVGGHGVGGGRGLGRARGAQVEGQGQGVRRVDQDEGGGAVGVDFVLVGGLLVEAVLVLLVEVCREGVPAELDEVGGGEGIAGACGTGGLAVAVGQVTVVGARARAGRRVIDHVDGGAVAGKDVGRVGGGGVGLDGDHVGRRAVHDEGVDGLELALARVAPVLHLKGGLAGLVEELEDGGARAGDVIGGDGLGGIGVAGRGVDGLVHVVARDVAGGHSRAVLGQGVGGEGGLGGEVHAGVGGARARQTVIEGHALSVGGQDPALHLVGGGVRGDIVEVEDQRVSLADLPRPVGGVGFGRGSAVHGSVDREGLGPVRLVVRPVKAQPVDARAIGHQLIALPGRLGRRVVGRGLRGRRVRRSHRRDRVHLGNGDVALGVLDHFVVVDRVGGIRVGLPDGVEGQGVGGICRQREGSTRRQDRGLPYGRNQALGRRAVGRLRRSLGVGGPALQGVARTAHVVLAGQGQGVPGGVGGPDLLALRDVLGLLPGGGQGGPAGAAVQGQDVVVGLVIEGDRELGRTKEELAHDARLGSPVVAVGPGAPEGLVNVTVAIHVHRRRVSRGIVVPALEAAVDLARARGDVRHGRHVVVRNAGQVLHQDVRDLLAVAVDPDVANQVGGSVQGIPDGIEGHVLVAQVEGGGVEVRCVLDGLVDLAREGSLADVDGVGLCAFDVAGVGGVPTLELVAGPEGSLAGLGARELEVGEVGLELYGVVLGAVPGGLVSLAEVNGYLLGREEEAELGEVVQGLGVARLRRLGLAVGDPQGGG